MDGTLHLLEALTGADNNSPQVMQPGRQQARGCDSILSAAGTATATPASVCHTSTSREEERKCVNPMDHLSGCFKRGEGLMLINRRARRGGSCSRGGSPSAISNAVIPILHTSTWSVHLQESSMFRYRASRSPSREVR